MKDMIGRSYFVNGRQVHPDEYFKECDQKGLTMSEIEQKEILSIPADVKAMIDDPQ